MKAVIHLASDGRGFDKGVGIEIEISSAPRIGDWISFCAEDYERIFKALTDWEDWCIAQGRWQKSYGDKKDEYREWWSEDDNCYRNWGALLVTDTAFLPAEDAAGEAVPGEYVLHVIVDDHGR